MLTEKQKNRSEFMRMPKYDGVLKNTFDF